MLTDQHLSQMLRNQDQQVISIIYDRYSAPLYGVALKIVKSEAIAEDVVQDAFVKIWKKSTYFDSAKGSFFSWMLNITRNTAIEKKRATHFKNGCKIHSIDCIVNTKKNQWCKESRVEQMGLRKLVKNLDEKHRTIIDLIYFNGYTQQEVSEELNIPLGTLNTSIKIALKALKKMFAEGLKVLSFLFILGY